MRHTMVATLLCAGITALGAPAIAAGPDTSTVNNRTMEVPTNVTTTQDFTMTVSPAGGCTKAQNTLESRMGVPCQLWRPWFNHNGTLIGGNFHASSDITVKGPMKGYFSDACEGQLWSTSNHHRWTKTDAGSYHTSNSGRHTLCTTPHSSSDALTRLVTSDTRDSATATPIKTTSSTGWVIHAHGNVVLKKVYHGTVTTPRGTYHAGQTPDHLSAGEQATFWYNG